MVNTIYFDVYRDDESVSTSSEFSSQRSDFPDESKWRNPSASLYSTIGMRIRSWIRSPMSPGSVQGEAAVKSDALNASSPPEIIPHENLAISLDELKKLTHNFSPISFVGQGPCSRVFHATLSTGEAVAVKKLNLDSSSGPDSDFSAQLAKVSRLEHHNLSGLLGYCLDLNNRILVNQFATMGSLHDILHGGEVAPGSEPGPVLTWNQRVKIACGAARGVQYIHNEGIVHGAISSRNILVFDDFVSKIDDIRLSNEFQYTDLDTLPWHAARVIRLLRPPYYPPEYFRTEVFTQKTDVFSFGVVLLELLTGRRVVMEQQSLVNWAIPRLSKDKVHQCIDPKLNTDYPPKAVAKLAAVAALCVQYEAEFRPVMDIVVKALEPLLKVRETHNSVSSPPPPPPSFP